ncbi:protein tamozhennic [Palaemon carinicauda]|uniref:protein tamozhennic n=1 Tax=Palaemon carinicauda TaxID=392227 RepID=UPI0035B63081
MTMYHMALPPHLGGPHPPTVHSPLFSSPILPPAMAHNYGMHAFPPTHMPHPSHSSHQSHSAHQNLSGHSGGASATGTSGPVGSGNSAMLTHPSPMLSQPSPMYPAQTSVYVNPYLSSPIPHALAHTHSHPPHQHPSNMGYGMPPGMMPPQQPSGQGVGAGGLSSGPVMSVDEELMDEMNTLHLGYIETEDNTSKMEQRVKLERVIMDYLAITPHNHKFMFHQISDVLEKSISTINDFSAYSAACAFDALAQYAANLIAQPWRKEYREVKLYSGFWVHQVARHLSGAESVLSLMGYGPRGSHPADTGENDPSCLVLEGVLDPDLISRLALDCLIAYCECQVLKKISEGVREFGLTWRQILQFRQLHVGGVEVTVRHLLFTLRQRIQPQIQPETSPRQSSTGPPLPVRQSSTGGASTSPVSIPTTHHPASAPHQVQEKSNNEQHSCGVDGNLGDRNSYHHHHHFHHPHHHTNGHVSQHPSITVGSSHIPVTVSQSPGPQVAPPLSYSRSADTPDTGKSVSSLGLGVPAGQVPTAKLIDLDSSLEALPSPRTSQMLPKVIPHKRSSKSSGSRPLPPLETSEPCPPPPPPPEVFQAGTLDEHLEATLSLVKDPNRNSCNQMTPNEQGSSSWETWDFVYRGLEKRGYNKDIGDRGDILHQMTRQNLYSEAVSGKNNKKEGGKINKPLTINQALQALGLNDNRERVERPSSSTKSSHSLSHGAGPDVFPNLTKRNSLYDNLSAGFETAPQDSDDYEDRRPVLKKTNNLLRNDVRLDYANKNNISNSSSPRSMSISSKSTHSRQELPSETSRSTTTALTLQQASITTSTPQSKEMQPCRDDSLQSPWSCTTCTFLNDKGRSACDMCGKSRVPGPEATPLISGGRQCPQCTLINEREAQDCTACGVHLEGSSTYI